MGEHDQQTSEELAVTLKELSLKIDRLKQLYEQYFMGIERMEPMVARKEVMRAMLTLQQGYIRNTALRFKFNTMLQKWSSYTTYWNRTLREIENGTYVRHLQKAARAAAEKGRALPTEMRLKLGLDDDAPELAVTKPVGASPAQLTPPKGVTPANTPPTGVAARPPVPGTARPAGPPPIPGAAKAPPPLPPGARGPTPPLPAAAGASPAARIQTPVQGIPGMTEADLRALHKKYSEARAATGETAPVRYESLVASLQKQTPKILEQPGVRGVKFDVSIRDGKPVLKAIPTK